MCRMVKHGLVILHVNSRKINKERIENMAATKHMGENRYKIMFLCNFSNPLVRERVRLERGRIRSLFYRFKPQQLHYETDYAVWVSDYIEQFEKHPEYEFHIISPMQGLRGESQHFEERGIYYHFYNCSFGLFHSFANVLLNLEERRDYPTIRRRISRIRERISPDLVLLCGAENPYYSIGVIDVKDRPVYVILQTLLNTTKRIEMNVGTPYKRRIELEIFRHAGFFCTSNSEWQRIIREQNEKAIMLPAGFPTHRPEIVVPQEKEYDYVFFAKTVAKYKGVEDLLKAMKIVKEHYPSAKLNIIGGVEADYQKVLAQMIENLGIVDNVHFAGQYQEVREVFENVAKSKSAVLPGVTGTLNSTIRESMLIGLPTICYALPATEYINAQGLCLLTVPMGDVEALARQMRFILEQPEQARKVADRGKEYAERQFSNEARVNKLLENCQRIIINAHDNSA